MTVEEELAKILKIFKDQGIRPDTLRLANYSRIAEVCRNAKERCFCGCHITELNDRAM
jgi:hypothetical protein